MRDFGKGEKWETNLNEDSLQKCSWKRSDIGCNHLEI